MANYYRSVARSNRRVLFLQVDSCNMHWNSIRQTSLSCHFHHSSLTVCPAPDASRRARTCLASHATALLPITPPGPATGDSEVEGLLNESETLAALFAQKCDWWVYVRYKVLFPLWNLDPYQSASYIAHNRGCPRNTHSKLRPFLSIPPTNFEVPVSHGPQTLGFSSL